MRLDFHYYSTVMKFGAKLLKLYYLDLVVKTKEQRVINFFYPDSKFIVFVLSLFLATLTSNAIASAEISHPAHSSMILLEAGCFRMGSEEFVSEEPIHHVCISSFYLDKFEVTQENFESVMGVNPSTRKANDFPVVDVL